MAWEISTAQVALVADGTSKFDAAQWRQLLFAGSGIRHQLSPDDASAYGTPVILAIVNAASESSLRKLAESLTTDYAVFSRVDLNLVPAADIDDPQKLDDALAPLLPRCRAALKNGDEISRREVQRFWGTLRDQIDVAAGKLDERFGSLRDPAGRQGADWLIGDSAVSEQLPALTPISKISMKNFRAIEDLTLELMDVNVIFGTNGSGKTSLIEAMEFAWAGTTQRKPFDVESADYATHLPRNGEGSFSIVVDGQETHSVAERSQAELARCVLGHETISDLVGEAPEDRFAALLEVTGLEVPDLRSRTAALVKQAKQEADSALEAAGMARLPMASSVGLRHLDGELTSDFLKQFAGLPDIALLEKTLLTASGGSYAIREWSGESRVSDLLARADSVVADAAQEPGGEGIVTLLDEAADAVEALMSARLAAAGPLRHLLEALPRATDTEQVSEPPKTAEVSPINTELASRWLAHVEAVGRAAERFRADASLIEDEKWAKRLTDYADTLDRAASHTPRKELERLTEPQPKSAPPRPTVDTATWEAAGFGSPPDDPEAVQPALRELVDGLQTQAEALRAIGSALKTHPAQHFHAHSERVMAALCNFELARTLRREGPILEASQTVVRDLLDDRLAPVVRELVAAIVRFEWYFKPLRMSTDAREIVFGGLATDRADLDARMVLNSAERTVLGIAWFLALHMLQPETRRRVLVLDDPTSGFDAANQAGFASTLRAFVRLTKPEQVAIATYDDAIAALLAEELAEVGGWPQSLARVRFQRDTSDHSYATAERAEAPAGDIDAESERLGLLEDAPAG